MPIFSIQTIQQLESIKHFIKKKYNKHLTDQQAIAYALEYTYLSNLNTNEVQDQKNRHPTPAPSLHNIN